MTKRLLKIAGWFPLWFLFFWAFLLAGFPTVKAKDWLADRLGKGLNAKVSIEELSIGWDLGVMLKGISISSQDSGVRSQEGTVPDLRAKQSEAVESGLSPKGFTINLASLNVEPRLLSLIRLKPEIFFTGQTPSGGDFSGFYDSEKLSLSFKDILFKDFSIAALPVPSTATASGSGKLKLTKGKGMIEIEVDGIPGGKQRAKVSGGENPGLDGKLKVTVSLPRL